LANNTDSGPQLAFSQLPRNEDGNPDGVHNCIKLSNISKELEGGGENNDSLLLTFSFTSEKVENRI
jgi:hypothetical protein